MDKSKIQQEVKECREKLERLESQLKKEDKYFDLSDFSSYLNDSIYVARNVSDIDVYNTSFFLGKECNWELRDCGGHYALIPTRK
jgi:hypothetical protein